MKRNDAKKARKADAPTAVRLLPSRALEAVAGAAYPDWDPNN